MIRRRRLFLVIIVTLLVIGLMFFLQDTILKIFLYPVKYEELVWKYAYEYDIDPFLIYAVIKAESGFKKSAESHKGAKGLMQITEQTGVWAADKLKIDNFKVEDLFEPSTNLKIGCWYLSVLEKQFENDITLVLAAYNAGSGNVTKWLKNKNLSKTGLSLETIPFAETKKYVRQVIEDYHVYKRLYRW
jgi:soluble lytic murein transglycosylase